MPTVSTPLTSISVCGSSYHSTVAEMLFSTVNHFLTKAGLDAAVKSCNVWRSDEIHMNYYLYRIYLSKSKYSFSSSAKYS